MAQHSPRQQSSSKSASVTCAASRLRGWSCRVYGTRVSGCSCRSVFGSAVADSCRSVPVRASNLLDESCARWRLRSTRQSTRRLRLRSAGVISGHASSEAHGYAATYQTSWDRLLLGRARPSLPVSVASSTRFARVLSIVTCLKR